MNKHNVFMRLIVIVFALLIVNSSLMFLIGSYIVGVIMVVAILMFLFLDWGNIVE